MALLPNVTHTKGFQARGEFGIKQPNPVVATHYNMMSFGAGGPLSRRHKLFAYFGYQPYLLDLGSSTNAATTAVYTYETPECVAWAQKVQPNSATVQMLANYPATGLRFRNSYQNAQQVFGVQNTAKNTGCGTPSTNNIPCDLPVYNQGNIGYQSYYNAFQYYARIDKIFDKDRLYGTFFHNNLNNGAHGAMRPTFTTTSGLSLYATQVNEVHTFSPNLFNEAMFGYLISTTTRISNIHTVPTVTVTTLSAGFGAGGDYQWGLINNSWRDNLTWLKGSHTFKFGYQGNRYAGPHLDFSGQYAVPTFAYTSLMNFVNNVPYSETGLSYDPITAQPRPYLYGYSILGGGAFVEDTWRVAKNLTINYGIRYDNYGNARSTISGYKLTNFHLGQGSTFQDQVANGYLKQASSTFDHDINWVFSPSVGFAYDPFSDGKLVVRGGIGLYHDAINAGEMANQLASNPPNFVVPTFYSNGSTAPPIFGNGTSETYPYGYTYPAFQGQQLDSKGGIVGSQIAIGGVDENLKPSYTLNWTFGVERALGKYLTASLGYVGSHSDNLVTYGNTNGNSNVGQDVNVFLGDLLKNPTFSGGSYTGSGTLTRLNKSFGAITYGYNAAWANYNAGIATVRGRFARRGSLVASYIHSKAMDNWGNYPITYPLLRQYYASSPWDVHHRFSVGANYGFPGDNLSNPILRRVAGGWRLGVISVLQSGKPFSVYTSNPLKMNTVAADGQKLTSANYASEMAAGNLQFASNSGDFKASGSNYSFPMVSNYEQKHGNKNFLTGILPACPGGALPCGQFSQPAVGQEGNGTPYGFRGPGYADVDVRLSKAIPIKDSIKLALQGDAFNVLNRVNLGAPSGSLNSGTFGMSTSASSARVIYVGARLTF